MTPETTRVQIRSEADIVVARQRGRSLAEEIGFSTAGQTLIATAISELARNIVQHAGEGEVLLAFEQNGDKKGVVIVASDSGPGIRDLEQAMQDGFSTSHSLGLGLPGARRLMDEFEITTEVGKGTTVTVKKWAK